ncbi:Glycosyltransferase involved in cell wall bisynthesis [Paracoccus isoporae]|uniref:Glycosyltransferase involved in cell wall bisynthesis n=1 Tax=Paracoccus isoporae TaxID=591205 RepID=A0A1G7BB20_9RHOB|nr:glycosyltransferase family 4 protein [Paracoccus isoporae]SDE24000.1 Glycosyltransferase involved in cell wall bisynthesis [Paracoccus isoporae]
MAERSGAGRPRRVVHVTEAPLGGVATYLDELLTAQLALSPDTQFDLISPEVNRAALTFGERSNFTFIGMEMRRGNRRDLISLAWRTIRHIRRTRPAILHIHSSYAGAAIRALSAFIPRGTRVVYCPHGWAFSREGSRKMQRGVAAVERALSRVTDRIICISDYERREALSVGIGAAKLAVIDNGISPRGDRPALPASDPDAPLRIAFAGRFDRQKGYDAFLEVMERLGPRATGHAIGSAIVSSDALPPVPENVELLGWQKREAVFDLFRRADLLLVPSRWEGFGLVAVEAMQARLAVFASRVGGLQDIVVDGETGRLFTPDRVDEIVALIEAARSHDLRRYGDAGYARFVEKYTAERMAREVNALYAELLT